MRMMAAALLALSVSGAQAQTVDEALARIAALNHAGPRLNAVIALSPPQTARTGPLGGMPVLIKDNIEAADGLPTTAGSLALTANVAAKDAPLVARIRAAGGVVIGRANLSEWANFRSASSLSGWSAVGGLVRNPYALDRGACGSSAGSAAAVAAGMARVAVGTETDGSITCPAAMNGVVGLKPTVGLVSRTGVVPISPEQDTAGPLARTVRDAALLLTAMAGGDPADPATREADRRKTDYAARLDAGALKGAQIGVLRLNQGRSPGADAAFETALRRLRDAGAILVEVETPAASFLQTLDEAEGAALRSEFRAAIEVYLAATPKAVETRSLADLIAFNAAEPREMALFGQDVFEAALKAPPLSDPVYRAARDSARSMAAQTLDGWLTTQKLDAVAAVSGGPASVVDAVNGSKWLGSPSTLPAVAGYPHLTVPMGQVSGLPVGLSLIGPRWSEARLLSLGYAFEQTERARPGPTFAPTVPQPAFDR